MTRKVPPRPLAPGHRSLGGYWTVVVDVVVGAVVVVG
jgi:hypothetical protein